ncbi:EF-P 5-aminopentanol modification-associated protein YfmH [Alicyclobacillus sp. ALC3]|uniref:EF-P 5-aminopentanol modification-associated protein YfmH n=1 Tax=Alicyclobacillus sp. ALC3 TaxID=2796143 RepID=UPI0023783B29|nr:pitrilysin family protein [Alicyclobacillus sp. ALC3]WDL98007.1 insulinase family protein [Alicyclobacillus sp. ALC3]
MREHDYSRFRQKLYTEQLDNGLTVCLLPKPGFEQVFATFSTHYGSIDSVFRLSGEPDYVSVPEGIAHFLEHKMFESPQGDVFNDFARGGATANAYTSYDQTTYLFSSTENVDENLRVLLDFVQEPYFTDASIEKEKGIIGQELRMYEDDPDRRSLSELLQAMYSEHPVRIDIGGTVESIQGITRDLLMRCYQTFYHPANMLLLVVGGFDPEHVLDLVRENQSGKSFAPAPTIDRYYPDEPAKVARAKAEVGLSVSQPRCLVGWKDAKTGLSGRELLHQELLTAVVLDVLFGRSSPTYQEWVDEGLIDQQFGWEYEVTPTYGFSLVGGNTTSPDTLLARINAALDKATEVGLAEADFERCRKKTLGRFVASLDSPYYIAHSYSSYAFKDVDLFDTADVLESLTLAQANERLRSHFVTSQQTVSVITPIGARA